MIDVWLLFYGVLVPVRIDECDRIRVDSCSCMVQCGKVGRGQQKSLKGFHGIGECFLNR